MCSLDIPRIFRQILPLTALIPLNTDSKNSENKIFGNKIYENGYICKKKGKNYAYLQHTNQTKGRA